MYVCARRGGGSKILGNVVYPDQPVREGSTLPYKSKGLPMLWW